MKIELRVLSDEEVAEAELPRCDLKPSPYSTARCEMAAGHKDEDPDRTFHAGRTRGGYWKFWFTERTAS